jgi:hypothetical protein
MSLVHRLPLALASALVVVPVLTAQAAPQYPIPRSPRVIVSPGFESGYARGVAAGEEDRRRGEPFNFTDESDYRRADTGYRREYGPIETYRTEFRRGFETGYRAAGERRGAIGRDEWGDLPGRGRGRGRIGGPAYRYDVASAQGFADGYNAGFDDGDRNRRYELTSEGRYRSGDHGYERWYGTREAYRANYREGFHQGYDEGYERGLRFRPW